jgi:7-carboxy-7-deazaguanine synthase
MLKLAEPIFIGYQGEGVTQGKRALFIRFYGCNLDCGFCDSKFAYESGMYYDTSINEIQEFIKENNIERVVLTGGEPLLQQDAISDLISKCESKLIFEIETNGTIKPDKLTSHMNVFYNVSPKNEDLRVLDFLKESGKSFIIKKVVSYLTDMMIDTLYRYKELYDVPVYIQPEGTNSKCIKDWINYNYEALIKLPFDLSIRSHIFLFENKRGV